MQNSVNRIEELIAPQLQALGFSVVRVKVFGGRRQVLQVMIERQDGNDVNIDECATASRAISPLLDVYDPLDDAYQLEVSSPGIDRPLTRAGDFERFAGYQVKVELADPIDGRRRFRGELLGLEAGGVASESVVRIQVEGQTIELSLAGIQSAKLVLTDELIAAHQDTSSAVSAAQ